MGKLTLIAELECKPAQPNCAIRTAATYDISLVVADDSVAVPKVLSESESYGAWCDQQFRCERSFVCKENICLRPGEGEAAREHQRPSGTSSTATSSPPGKQTASMDVKDYVALGALSSLKGDFDEAIRIYSIAIQVDPASFDAYYHRGGAFLLQQDLLRAEKDYSSALRLNPRSAEAYVMRANVLARLNKLPEALRDYDLAVRLGSADSQAILGRGAVQIQLGRVNEGCRDLQAGQLALSAKALKWQSNPDIRTLESAIGIAPTHEQFESTMKSIDQLMQKFCK